MKPEINSVTASIINGSFTEEEVSKIVDSLAVRKAINAQTVRISLKVGQPVWLKSGRPAYLNGAAAVVVKINREKVVIDLLKPIGSFFKNIRCPASMLSLTEVKA